MESYYGLLILLFAIILWYLLRRKQKKAAVAHHLRKRKEEIVLMQELAKRFLDKECIIYTITSTSGDVQGTIREVTGSGLLLEDPQGQLQAINLEYVTRIREHPRDKKGKKKNFILD